MTTVSRALLPLTATVYTADAAGAYTVVERSGLRCQLGGATLSNRATTAEDRAELAAFRVLFWQPDVTISERAQVEVKGERWNVVAGRRVEVFGRDGARAYWRCDVTRAVA